MRRNRNANRDLTRRQALAGAAATASTILAWRPAAQAAASTKVCILTPEAAQGPFYFDPKLVRTDIRGTSSAGVRPSRPLGMELTFSQGKSAGPLERRCLFRPRSGI